MKIKTSELTGAALDWAVAKCSIEGTFADFVLAGYAFHPSTNWMQGGPIIEREGIGTYKLNGKWAAHCTVQGSIQACLENQPTPLIAAMRCYVASKLGDNIDIPEELQ